MPSKRRPLIFLDIEYFFFCIQYSCGNFKNWPQGKWGLLVSKTVTKEWGPYGVRSNAIAFGFIDTRYV